MISWKTVWQDLDDTSKTAAAQALAGKHQVNRFMALMENSDMYQEYLGATGASAAGTLEQMNSEYLDSLQGRLTKLQSTLEGLFSSIFNTDDIYPWIDALQGFLDLVQDFIDAIGGAGPVLTGILALVTQIFSKNIAQGITDSSINIAVQRQRAENYKDKEATLQQWGAANPNPEDPNSAALLGSIQKLNTLSTGLSTEQWRQGNQLIIELRDNINSAAKAEENLNKESEALKLALGSIFGSDSTLIPFTDDNGFFNTENLTKFLSTLDQNGLKDIFKGSQNEIKDTVSELKNFYDALTLMNTELEKAGTGSEDFSNSINLGRDALDNLSKVMDKEKFSLLENEFEKFAESLLTGNYDIKETEDGIRGLNNDISLLIETLTKFTNTEMAPQDLDKLNDIFNRIHQLTLSRNNAQNGADNARKTMWAFLDAAEMQTFVQGVVEAVGAMNQLAFGIQSIQNLGSIWSNDDMKFTEKLVKSFMVLTSAIPSIVFAFRTLKQSSDKVTKSLQKQAVANTQLLVSESATTTKTIGQTAAFVAQTAAVKLTTAAMQGLNSALAFLSGPGGMIVAGALTLIGARLNWLQGEAEKTREELNTAFTDAYADTQIDTSQFDSLYDEYKRTGEVSDELKEAAENLGEQLDITGTKAYVASGNFELLAEEINNAKEASIELSKEAANDLFTNIDVQTKSLFGQIMLYWHSFKDSVEDTLLDITNIVGILTGFNFTGFLTTDMYKEITGIEDLDIAEITNLSTDERYIRIVEQIEEWKKLEQQLNEEGRDFEASIVHGYISNWQNYLDETYAGYAETIESMSELTISELDISEFEGMGADQIIATLLDPNGDYEWIARQYNLLAAELGPEIADEFLDGILNQINPQEWADKQLELLTQQAQNSAQLVGKANGTPEYIGGYWDQFNSLLDFGTANNLSSKNIVDVAGLIDWNSPNLDQELANLLERMRASVKGGLSIDDFISIEQAGGAEEYLRNVTSSDKSVSDEDLQNASLTLYNNNDFMSQYADDLELVPPLVAEIAEAQLRYNAAVETSTQNMEKWNQTFDDIENHNENLKDVTDTINDLRETYSDFLDLSEDVSDEFIRNRKNLERLERAINGDTEAYNELAEAAAEDITLHLGLDEDEVDEAIETVQNIYDILNSDKYQALKAGDLIDLSTFPDLWDLLQQYVSYLSSLGLSIDEIRQKIMELFHIDIPENAFAGPEAAVAQSADNVAGKIDSTVGHIKDSVSTVPRSVKKNLSFAQKTKIKSLKDKKSDKISYTNLTAKAIPHHQTVTLPAGEGGKLGGSETFQATYYSLHYIPDTHTIPQIKENTGQAIESEVETGEGASGGVSLMDLGGGAGQFSGEGVRTTAPGGGFTPTGSLSPSSGGGGSGGCFVAGTLVSLQNQFKNIEDIQIGDIVLSYNEEIHQNEYSIVLQTMIHDVTEEIYNLYIEDEVLTVTGIHRFYVRRKHDIEWVPASDLHIGDYVLFADGNWHPIFKIKVKICSLLVYNFEVSHNHNYYVGRNQILAHNKGGGGGGSGKTIEPKEEQEHQKDYYEEVDSQLSKIKEELSGIEKQEDKLIGDKARANQAKQIALLNKEVDLQKEKLRILREEEIPDVEKALREKDTAIEKLLQEQGVKFTIPDTILDEDGIISNYEDISLAITDAHNALIRKYNNAASAGNEELTKSTEKVISNFDKESKAILDNIKNYNKLQTTAKSWENDLQDILDTIENIRIELYKTSMDTIDNLKDLNEKWAEFEGLLTGMPSDSPFRDLTVDLLKLNSAFEISKKDAEEYYQEIINGKLAARDATDDKAEKEAIQASINYFTGLKEGLTDDMLKNGLLGLAMTDLDQLEKWYRNDPTAGKNPFGENQKELVEAYQEGYERVLELSQDWQDLQEDIVDDVIDGFDEIADKQDRQLEKYERLAEELESLADTYALSYGDESYKALSDIGKRQAEILKAQLSQYVNIYDYWEKRYEDAIGTGNEELINSIEDRMNDVRDEMRDLAQESAEAFVEAYENAMDAAVQDMYQNLFGENNLDHLDRNWEWDKKIIDNYRDEVEKTFEIEQLRSKYNDLLNDAQGSSLATQNKIRKQMQEQLDLLKNQESMSEYDVELANSKLLILQKQIALEDAQQNKNQMQLRRDSQGNYRYVYRASQNDIAKARQEYMQAVQDAYELTKDQRQKSAEELSNTLKDYANEWRDLSTNMNLTEEQRLNQSKELTTKFLEYMKHLNEDLTDSQLGMSDVLNFMVEIMPSNKAMHPFTVSIASKESSLSSCISLL